MKWDALTAPKLNNIAHRLSSLFSAFYSFREFAVRQIPNPFSNFVFDKGELSENQKDGAGSSSERRSLVFAIPVLYLAI